MADDKEKADEQSGEKEPFFSVSSENNPTASCSSPAEGPGTQVGPYKLLGILGEGGFGIVYLAEEREPIKRRVALKIIKPGMDSKEVLARFDAERQTLALLDHPNIAHIFGAGITSTGRPYFAMEYVKGLSINEHCDQHKLNIKERLELFLQVCKAVQHAHQKGIIHRDIKPSNILVSVEDDQRLPKVIDFGVAKAMWQTLTEQTLYTQAGQVIGTPEYMSPEQAQMSPQGIDTRSDIYSLGAVLYELLTGVLPFDPERLRPGGIDAMRRMICEEEPKTPSTRLAGLGEAGSKVALQRQTDVVSLTRCLHRELEWIPLMAMRKDRERRYQSVSELANDIENYLKGTPLLAGPESAAYRAKKFVQRHAGAVAAATALLLTLVVGLLVSMAMYSRSETARGKEVIARTRAEQAEGLANERAEAYRRVAYRNRIALADAKYDAGNAGSVKELLKECPSDLRGWEWYYLWHISDEASVSLQGHNGQVFGLAISPDGKRIASASLDKTAKIWDTDTGKEVMTLRGHDRWVVSVAFSRNGERIVTGGDDQNIILWNAQTGEQLLKTKEDDYGPLYGVLSVAANFDGGRIAWCGHASEIKVWDIAINREPVVFTGHNDAVMRVVFNTDGTRLLSTSDDGTVKVWEVSTGNCITTCRGRQRQVRSAVFDADEKTIVTGSNDGLVRIYDVNTGEELRTLHGRGSGISSISCSPDGKYIASGNADCTVSVWDVAAGAEIRVFRGHGAAVTSVCFHPDGSRIVSASGDGLVKVWDLNVEGKSATLHGHTGWVSDLAFSPDGNFLASACQDQTVKIWDVQAHAEVRTLRGHSARVYSVSFSPDGNRLVSGSLDGTVRLWDAHTGEEIRILRGHAGSVTGTAFSSDGKRIVSAGEDRTARVWDAATGKETMTLHGHEEYVYSACFTPDGKLILTSSGDGTVRIWDAIDGTHLKTLEGHAPMMHGLTVSRDGKRVACGGGKWWETGDVVVWDIETGEELLALPHPGRVWEVAFSADGKRLFSGGASGPISVWDIETREELLTIRFPNDPTSMALSPDGSTLAVGTLDIIKLLRAAAPGEAR